MLDWWPLYPEYVHQLFLRAFTAGIRDGQSGRVQEGEWITALSSLRDSLIQCPECGAENSFHVVIERDDGQPPRRFWHCAAHLPRPLHLVTRRSLVVLAPGRQLHGHQIELGGRLELRRSLGRVEVHPGDPTRLGLRNMSERTWKVTKEDGEERLGEPERLFPRIAGRTIDFGTMTGEVCA